MLQEKKSAPYKVDSICIGDFTTEHGEEIENVNITYERVGPIDAPVIFICHALTGNHISVGEEESSGWWSGLVGSRKHINTDIWQVVTMNVLGGCNGSTGPLTLKKNGEKYGSAFPFFTVRDIVKSHYIALQQLGIQSVHAIIGGSLGGMQVLEWGLLYPTFAKILLPLATSPFLSDYGIAFNTIARYAITTDSKWENGEYQENPTVGLSIARMVGLISYRSSDQFNTRFKREMCSNYVGVHKDSTYQVESYLMYQGEKFVNRFDTNSYLYLLKAMDYHDIGRNRGGWKEAIQNIKTRVCAFSFKDDLIYPPELLQELVDVHKENGGIAKHFIIDTAFGHDGFLVQFEKWGHLIEEELNGTH